MELEKGKAPQHSHDSQNSDVAKNSEDSIKSPPPREGDTEPSVTDQASLEDSLESLSIEAHASKGMFRSLASIFQASQMHDGSVDRTEPYGSNIWAILRYADQLEAQGGRDISGLNAVRAVLDQMALTSSQLLLPAVKIIADASRDRECIQNIQKAQQHLTMVEATWRAPFAESGILDFAITVATSPAASMDLDIQCLRLIGNSCADRGILGMSYIGAID
jgi:hypothetical protein